MIVNLTPHTIKIYNEDGQQVAELKSEGIARISVQRTKVGEVEGVPIFETITGDPEGLPEPKPGVIYVVSGMFRGICPRGDLYQPGELLRNDEGQPIGCVGLSQ